MAEATVGDQPVLARPGDVHGAGRDVERINLVQLGGPGGEADEQ
jgi:hypothetical protein